MDPKPDVTTYDKLINRFHDADGMYDNRVNQLNLSVFVSSSNENYTYLQAMQQKDKDKFSGPMVVEMAVHEERDHWKMVPQSSLPVGAKKIRSIWSFKRERLPDGSLNKHNAIIFTHGDMQRWGENYWETYYPVVNIMSVHLLPEIAHIHCLNSKWIDFLLAFPQADIDIDIWMELPKGMIKVGDESNCRLFILKLNKSLYGMKQGSHNWYEKLNQYFLDWYLTPSNIDPCIFMKDGMILLVYADDCIILAEAEACIDVLIHSLRNEKEKYILTEESSIDKFIGNGISKLDCNRYELAELFLIEWIVELIESECPTELNGKQSITTAVKPLLHKYLMGVPRKCGWN